MTLRRTLHSAAAVIMLVMAIAPAHAEDASLSLDAIAKARGRALVITPPSLEGIGARSAGLTFVFNQAGQAWIDAKRQDLSLVVSQNGRIIAETKLSPDRWSYDLALPTVPSEGRLTAALVDADNKCVADGLAPALDLGASRIRADLNINGARLDALPALLGPAFAEGQPLTIWSPHGVAGKSRLTAALSVVEGFALAYRGDVPLISVEKLRAAQSRQTGPLPGAESAQFKGPIDVVIGTAGDLESWVPQATISEITGPYVAISALPGSPTRWIVIVSGRDRAEVEVAASTFADRSFVWPKGRGIILGPNHKPAQTFNLPGVAWGPDHPSGDSKSYQMEGLGYGTTQTAGEIHLPIVTLLGADDLDPDAEIVVRPNFVYAPGYRGDASWQAYIDDQFMGAIALSPSGGRTADAEIRIPVKHLRRGFNDLTLIPNLPEASENCLEDRNTVPATWFGDGTVEAPFIGGGRIRASLSAFGAIGHLNPAAIDRPVAIVVESSEDDTVSAALTIAARITKAARMPIPGLILSESNEEAPNADLVLVGTHTWAASILKIGEDHSYDQFPAFMADGLRQIEKAFAQGDGRDQLMAYLASDEAAAATPAVFGWSTREGQSVVTAAFTDETLIKEEAYRLVAKTAWNRMAGDYFSLGQPYKEPKVLAVADPDTTATSQNPDPFARVHAWAMDAARTAPGRVALVIFGALVALIISMRLAVASRRAREAERRRD